MGLLAQAHAHFGAGELGKAESALNSLLARDPDSVAALVLKGNVLNDLGRPAEAMPLYQRALQLKPDAADALANLGNALQYLGRLGEAVACYRQAIALAPDYREAHHNLGNALESLDRQPEAVACFSRALALDVDFVEARWAIAMSQLRGFYASELESRQCRDAFARELEALEAWFDPKRSKLGYRAAGIQQPFALAYQEENNRALLERYGTLCARLMGEWFDAQGLAAPAPRADCSVVHIGVVSQYFRDHSVWNALMRGWFEKIDSRRFALHAFYLGAHVDAETDRCRRHAAQFHMGGMGLRAWTETILASRLQVLVYPDIGMDPMATKLACLRLAPLQLASWGHPETTGLPTIDAYLSAHGMEPPGAQAHYTEKLIALPNLGCCFARTGTQAQPAEFSANGPLFICPGTPFKYMAQHDWTFAEIARKLGRCTFVFFVHQGRTDLAERLLIRLRDAFARLGLRAEDHVVFLPWLARSRFYGLMQRADVFLDTIGFSGFNTAMQAVECTLPLVTFEGKFLRGRFGSSILQRMGLHDLIARSTQDYVHIAVRLASEPEYRARVREKLAARRGILFDDIAPIRAMEDYLAGAVGCASADGAL
ncbi:MAG: tetratricopeptide repeat protein [Betaproteobacteria bacterium]|nr:tetratricopeptide repeat protein [Betaproteobacteria bacterium]MDH4325278.1 tetratricopeptide repeat protein [Betaproteobacteria bacterium]